MKFPNFKKYFFSYITIVLSYYYFYLEWIYSHTSFPQTEPDTFFQSEGMFSFFVLIIFLCSFFSILLLGLEIIIKKFIIEKYFPKLKISLRFKFPEIVSRIYSYIFTVLFILATVPVLFIGIYLFVMYIIDILS